MEEKHLIVILNQHYKRDNVDLLSGSPVMAAIAASAL